MSELVNSSAYLAAGSAIRDWAPKADLTYRLFEGEEAIQGDLTRSLLIGTVFRNCRFTNTKFDNCDIEGANFIGCVFVGCTFSDADIRSCAFVDCHVETCGFERALLQDLLIRKTVLRQSSFEKASVHENKFVESVVDECSLQNASVLHNEFSSTSFFRMRFADCTFLYTTFAVCTFDEVAMNVEAIGVSFGLTMANIESFDLVFLGDSQKVPPSELIEAFRSTYRERRWGFSEAMLEVSFGPKNPLAALTDAVDVLLHLAYVGVGVKRDEFRFLTRVAVLLAEDGRLPLGFLSHALEASGQLLERQDLTVQSAKSVVQELHNQLYLLIQQSVETFQATIGVFSSSNDLENTIRVTLTYAERPTLNSAEIVHFAASIHGETVFAELLDARAGSWIEVIQTTVLGMIALYALLAATNGVFVQIIRARALAPAAVRPLPKRTAQSIVRKAILAPEAASISRASHVAMGLLSACTKLGEARQDATSDLARLQSISVDET